MSQLLLGLWVLIDGGLLALIVGRSARWANAIGAGTAVAGSGIALVPVIGVLVSGRSLPELAWAWNVPFGSFTIGLDPLSAWFAAAILGLAILAAVYGAGYLAHYADRKSLGPPWLFFNLLVAAMVLVVVARNGSAVSRGVGRHGPGVVFPRHVRRRTERRARSRPDLPDRLAPGHGLFALVLCAVRLACPFAGLLFFGSGQDGGPLERHARRCAVPAGARRVRHEGRLHAAARLASRSPSRGAQPRLGLDVRRDDQDGHLRFAAGVDHPRTAAGLVGLAAGRDRVEFRRAGRAVRAGPTRPEAAAGVPQRREHRHHCVGAGRGPAGAQRRLARAGRAGVWRRAAARAQSCDLQRSALPGRRRGVARRGHAAAWINWAAC